MTRPPPHSRNQTGGAPRAIQMEDAWFVGQRESARRLPPRDRRGRPVQPGARYPRRTWGGLEVDRPGREQRSKVR
jgi:hypothetical protein